MVTQNTSSDLEITLAIEPTMGRNPDVRQQPRDHSAFFWAVLNDRYVLNNIHPDQREPKIFCEAVDQELRVESIPLTSYVTRWNDSHREAMVEIGDRIMSINFHSETNSMISQLTKGVVLAVISPRSR